MLQTMEDAWLNLSLQGHHDSPLNRGWMNVFRRWSNAAAFHRVWPILRSEFSTEFVRFCESHLHLTIRSLTVRPRSLNLAVLTARPRPSPSMLRGLNPPDHLHASILELDEEFGREWPAEVVGRRGLIDRIARAESLNPGMMNRLPVWMIWVGPAGVPGDLIPAGIVLAQPWTHRRYPARQNIPTLELFVWIRPVHRSTGLGTRAVRRAINKTRRYVLRGATAGAAEMEFRVRYPAWRAGGGSMMAVNSWRSFFAVYDFKDLDSSLRRDLHGEQILTRILL
jgi:hypothetical protein